MLDKIGPCAHKTFLDLNKTWEKDFIELLPQNKLMYKEYCHTSLLGYNIDESEYPEWRKKFRSKDMVYFLPINKVSVIESTQK